MIENQHVPIPIRKEGTGVLAVTAEITAPVASTKGLLRLSCSDQPRWVEALQSSNYGGRENPPWLAVTSRLG